MSDNSTKNTHDPESLAVLSIMRNVDGRAFMWDQLQSCCVFENIFHADPIEHARCAGRREAGLELERKLKENEPVYYLKMIEENM